MVDISVLIPAYNPRFLACAIQSALAQDDINFEIIVSDDRLDDKVFEVVSPYLGCNVQYVKNDVHGPGKNRDNLLRLAKGEFIKFLFDDDLLLKGCLSSYLKLAIDNDADAVFSNLVLIDADHKIKGTWPPGSTNLVGSVTKSDFAEKVIRSRTNLIGGLSSVMVRKSFFESTVSAFSINGRPLGYLTDVALYSGIVLRGKTLVGDPGHFVAFRVHGEQTSSSTNPLFILGVVEWEIFLRHFREIGLITLEEYSESMRNQVQYYLYLLASTPKLYPFIELNSSLSATAENDSEFFEQLESLYEQIEALLGRPVIAHGE